MSLQKQSEIAADFTNKLLDLISKTNKQLQKVGGNPSINNIHIAYIPCYPWAEQDRIYLKVLIKTDAGTNNNISSFAVEITK